jgi:uncharacterized membrane protein
MLSGLFLAAMSVDRLLAVRFPMAATRLCTTTRAKITVVLITIPTVAINVNTFFVYEYIEDIKAGGSMVVAGHYINTPYLISKMVILFQPPDDET